MILWMHETVTLLLHSVSVPDSLPTDVTDMYIFSADTLHYNDAQKKHILGIIWKIGRIDIFEIFTQ